MNSKILRKLVHTIRLSNTLQFGYFDHQKKHYQINQLFQKLQQPVESHEHGFTALILNYNDQFEQNRNSFVFIEETMRRLYSHKQGFDCDEESYCEFVQNIVQFLQDNLLDGQQLNRIVSLMERISLLNQNQNPEIVFLIIKQLNQNMEQNQVNWEMQECLLNILNNWFIDIDLKELLANEVERNIQKFKSLESTDIYQSAIQLRFSDRFNLEKKQVIDRMMSDISDIYRNSTLDQNQLMLVAYELSRNLDLSRQENETIINFFLEQFVEKDSMIYNHENYEYQFEGNEDQNDANTYTFQDSLKWQTIDYFLQTVTHPSTSFYQQSYMQWFDDMVIRKTETDTVDLMSCISILARLSETDYETEHITAMLVEMLQIEILENPDDQLFVKIDQQYLFGFVKNIARLNRFLQIDGVDFILKRVKGFVKRNPEKFDDKQKQELKDSQFI